MQGETKAHFTLPEAKVAQETGHRTPAFRLIDGKADGKGNAVGKAFLGKFGIGLIQRLKRRQNPVWRKEIWTSFLVQVLQSLKPALNAKQDLI